MADGATVKKEADDVKVVDDSSGNKGDVKGAGKAAPITVEVAPGKTMTFANQEEMVAKVKELAGHADAGEKLIKTEGILGQIVQAYRDPKNVEASTAYFMHIGGHSPAEARKMAEQRATNATKAAADPDEDDDTDDDDDGDTDVAKKPAKKKAVTGGEPARKIGLRDLDPELQRTLGGVLAISSDAAHGIEDSNISHVERAIQADQVLRVYWENLKPKQKTHLINAVRTATGVGKGARLTSDSLMKGIQQGREFAVSMWDDVTPTRGSRTGSGHDLITGDNYSTDDAILDEITAEDPFVSAGAAFEKRGLKEPEDRHSRTQAALEAIHRDQTKKDRARPR